MKRILVFGNSGSGKTTLSGRLARGLGIAHFDLDEVAWVKDKGKEGGPVRMGLDASWALMEKFIAENEGWVIEGCYGDLLEMLLEYATDVVFLDLPVEVCVEHARGRAFEPSKYASKEAQDANLPMLIEWIGKYEAREDEFSRTMHEGLFAGFEGEKHRVKCDEDVERLVGDIVG